MNSEAQKFYEQVAISLVNNIYKDEDIKEMYNRLLSQKVKQALTMSLLCNGWYNNIPETVKTDNHICPSKCDCEMGRDIDIAPDNLKISYPALKEAFRKDGRMFTKIVCADKAQHDVLSKRIYA